MNDIGHGSGLAGVACAHPDGCVTDNGTPTPAKARWKGVVPYCGMHYARARRTGGDPGPVGPTRRQTKAAPCCICGGQCYRGHHGRPYCSTHFSRVSRTGEPGPAERMRERGEPCALCGGTFRRRVAGEPLCEKHSQQRRHQLNRDAELARNSRYYAENWDTLRDASISRSNAWRADDANADRYRATRAAYRARHREHRRADARRRQLQLSPTVEPAVLRLILNDPCAYCGSREDVTVDHVVPLAADGGHDSGNLTAACRRCNAQKRERPLLRFLLARALTA